MRNAKFPYKKYLSDFDLDKYSNDLQFQMKNLYDLSFIKKALFNQSTDITSIEA